MRITISHHRSKADVMQKIDQSLDELFRPSGRLPLRLVVERRSWQGSTLHFAFTAKMGLVATPFKGMIDVTDSDVTIDVDFGLLERLISGEAFGKVISNRVRGLLN